MQSLPDLHLKIKDHAGWIVDELYEMGPDDRTPAPDFQRASFFMDVFFKYYKPNTAAESLGDDNKISDIYQAVEIIDQPVQFLSRPTEDQPLQYFTPPVRTPKITDEYAQAGPDSPETQKYDQAWMYLRAVQTRLRAAAAAAEAKVKAEAKAKASAGGRRHRSKRGKTAKRQQGRRQRTLTRRARK